MESKTVSSLPTHTHTIRNDLKRTPTHNVKNKEQTVNPFLLQSQRVVFSYWKGQRQPRAKIQNQADFDLEREWMREGLY